LRLQVDEWNHQTHPSFPDAQSGPA
jgi:hypothetical protein